ncbi:MULTISPECIES: glycerophosphodiester phosphodiesterase family protein [unclassified Paenibacillus]|uniref:glycerophosphodiester phosphodiesterase n=1 Tax=unclassified Paenibacillus TaxID=185978 RepID=UPI00104E85A8|nr:MULTISPECIES: glycerophosphodiester phosphodiesterase family protein [unclassified Paenibacillus]NIK67159.1 glycerophosphoryl diester phosphodiesterase [Paenibacillus sp. BK720]TCN01204.1 glycerophosphoryl diester phosphodiesterase [Paenibacillus sp. BK033]
MPREIEPNIHASSPIVIGHRGAAGEAPENTLASFMLAAEQGSHMVELDIHLSEDGKLIVCHDDTLDRTTDSSGAIRLLHSATIREADAGSWFSPAFAGEKVPFLEEVYDLLPQHIEINVEVKDSAGSLLDQVLLDYLRGESRLERTVVSSFDHKLLLRLKQAEPELRIGLLYAADLIHHASYAALLETEVWSLHPHHGLIGAQDAEDALAAGLQVYPYTANHPAEWDRLVAAGVTGIITDFPGLLKEHLNRL